MPDRQRMIREQKAWEIAEVTPNVFIMTHEFTHSVIPVSPKDCLAEGGGQATGRELWPLWYQASEGSLRNNSVSGQGQVRSFSSLFFPERHNRTCSIQSLLQHADERTWLGQDTNQTAGQGQEILLHIILGHNRHSHTTPKRQTVWAAPFWQMREFNGMHIASSIPVNLSVRGQACTHWLCNQWRIRTVLRFYSRWTTCLCIYGVNKVSHILAWH